LYCLEINPYHSYLDSFNDVELIFASASYSFCNQFLFD